MSQTPKNKDAVYLFGTCLIDVFYPQAGLDALALLELCGFTVTYPLRQSCCGQPAFNSGFAADARKVAEATIDLFSEQNWPLIVPSASCAGMIKIHYPRLFEPGSRYHHKALALAARTRELISFIRPHLPYQQQLPITAETAALHLSCCALREMDCADDWRHCLSQINNIEYCLPEDSEECCGFGGTFSVKSPDVSIAMTADKSAHLKASGAERIVSGDCGCLMNLEGYLRKQGDTLPVEHLASTLARHFGVSGHEL